MRQLILGLILTLFLPTTALAQQIGMMVIDNDPKGTNVREVPKGKISYVIPLHPKNSKGEADYDLRRVVLIEQKEDWFHVRLANDKTGWMPASVLGGYIGGTEDGPCQASRKPQANPSLEVPSRVLLNLENMEHALVQMSWKEQGKVIMGWLPEQCLDVAPWRD